MRWNGADRRAATAALALILLSVSACGTTPPRAPAESADPKPTIAVTPLPPKPDAAVLPPPEKPKPRQEAVIPPPPAEPINDDPNQLMRQSGLQVAALLGPASFVRRDGTAEIWQYRAAQCVLDVFLYREGSGLAVAHVELRKRSAATVPPRRCFATLLASKR